MKYTSTRNPMFRNAFAEDIFNQKYRHEGALTWAEMAKTLVDDVCQNMLSNEDKAELTQYITEMQFIPGGRYLYYAGRTKKFFNNCLAGSTKVLTNDGWKTLRDTVGEVINVVSPIDGKVYPAEIKSHGTQKLNKITFAIVKGHQRHTWEVRATRTHHWPLANGSDTYDLRVGDVVPANNYSAEFDALGFAHGFVFGDGNRNGQLRLCADKDKKWLTVLETVGTVTYPPSANGDPVLYFNQDIDWKAFPKEGATREYIASFIKGWIAADGSEIAGCKLHSVDRAYLTWFREYAAYAGIVITGELRSQIRDIELRGRKYENHEIFIQSYAYGDAFPGFKVVNIEPDGEEEVYCPFEPVHNRIVIDHNIDTFNCYLLRAEHDSREDWAELSKKVELCLSTGGGIGVDYSIYRAEGAVLHGTGGVASGPISKAQMVNEIGRQIMQGGSRRSAIYASLNWRHPDAGKLMKAKNWRDMPVGSTGASLWDIKQQDFNFPAPLDMTNVSLNYDTSWLLEYWKTGKVGDLFTQNVRQALSTGEPGFSFNFFNKERETLRNACCEVTSEDDSDICNLGSVNFSRIKDIQQLCDVVDLATKFLVCGTLRSQVPYDKVEQVRQKNRRIGVGLMGLHEWLIQRGYKYEVTPELHQWLYVYKKVSNDVADRFAGALSISKPIAKRAVAPTGTIGIMAGTSTGIEPVFSVAYKRRFLKGTKWHYQYVVDGTAGELARTYGVNPDNIESALGMSADPERRIKLQADVQDYVDMAISSTINLPAWGTEYNNEDKVDEFAAILAKYAHRLRGFTCYPDGSRGGQPLTPVSYKDAVEKLGETFEEHVEMHDVCSITGRGGVCGS